MGPWIVLASVFLAAALAARWIVSGGSPLPDADRRTRRWQFTDFHPPDKPGHDRTPDLVEHALDLNAGTYEVVTTWYHYELEAESDTSEVWEKFDIRRDDNGRWQIWLVLRNGAVMEQQPWQPAPARFAGQWDQVRG